MTPWVGRPLRRFEDGPLVVGAGCFTADLPAELFVRFLRSPVACGRLTGITAPPGATVVTAQDLTGVKRIRPILERPDFRAIGQPVLAVDVVRFVGEAVAAVVAASEAEAEDIADQVEVSIEPQDAVITIADALAGRGSVHPDEAPGNVLVEGRIKTAGVDAAFAQAAAVVEVELRSGRQNAMPLEARAGHAAFERSTGRITLTCTTQMPHLTRTAIADLIGMPESDLRVVAPDVGGGFGQKMALAPEYVLLVVLARRFRTSVAWREDRRENLISSFHSRDQQVRLKGAFDAKGKLLALDAEVAANVGAYSSYPVTCGVEPLMALAEMPGPYDVQEYACTSRAIATNTCPMAPYRGVSRPVITMVLESLMDRAAARLDIDPAALRRRNLVDRFPYRSATGLVFDEGSYRETLDLALARLGYEAFRERQAASRARGRYLGLGIATFSERTGYGTPAFAARGMEVTPGFDTAEIAMDPSGFVEVRIGASPHGQGLRTTLAQIVADEVGVSPERIRIVHGDTDRTPYGFGTFASRSLVISGGATLMAARQLKAKIADIAAHLLEAAPADIVVEGGAAVVAGTDRTIPLERIARAAYHAAQKLGPAISPGLAAVATYDPAGTFSNACHLAVVEVDPETGEVRIERYIVAEDAGRLINPMIVDGQIRGGVTQGIGNALLEEIVYDDEGNILTASLADFLPPTAAEIPHIEIEHLETLTDASLTKAKGLGEGGAIGAPAAVLGAINDALKPLGVSITAVPATPRRIRAALRAAAARVS